MADLTANEKAATFVGWKKDSLCSLRDNDGYCAIHNIVSDYVAHPIPAPDMSDARNYMQAWHSFADNRNFQRIMIETNKGAEPYRRFKVWINDIGENRLTNCYPVSDIGEGIVKALADLYDHERSNG